MKNDYEWLTVNSTRIAAIRYNLDEKILEVAFKNGELYEHEEVPPNFWTEMSLAESIGKYYFDNIRKTFPYEVLKWENADEEVASEEPGKEDN